MASPARAARRNVVRLFRAVACMCGETPFDWAPGIGRAGGRSYSSRGLQRYSQKGGGVKTFFGETPDLEPARWLATRRSAGRVRRACASLGQGAMRARKPSFV